MVVDRNSAVVDVVIRFHDSRRLYELERAVFSLFGQSYRPINIVLALQRFTDEEVSQTARMMEGLLGDDHDITFEIARWDDPEPRDGRSVLMSLGMRRCAGRYMAFLDYDDTLYPEAYELLVGALTANDAAIAFGSLRILQVDVFENFLFARRTHPIFVGSDLRDLFRSNFCPIHSFMVDRSQIPEIYMYFDPSISIEEDYDFLMRICSTFKSDFSLVGKQIGDYIYKSDGSNTVPAGGVATDEFKTAYVNTLDFMSARRRLITLSPAILRSEGIDDTAKLTIDDFLKGNYSLASPDS